MNLSTGDRDETRTTTYFSSAQKKYARSIDSSPRASSSSSCVETREDGGRARDIADTRGWSSVGRGWVGGSFTHSLTLIMDVGVVYCVYSFHRCVVCVVVVGTDIACV